jgi:23S rRNA (uracil1939-C5)-methyltransferase
MGRRRRKFFVVENISISGLADKGRGVGRDEEGKVFFVENVVPGDVVDVLVTKKKENFHEGQPHRFRSYSQDRTVPFCEHFGTCGGCQLQHLRYQSQLEHKQLIVQNALQRIGKIEVDEVFPILGANSTTYYRNKIEFAFSNKRWLSKEDIRSGVSKYEDVLGFHRAGAFDKILDIRHCYLQPAPSNELRTGIKTIAKKQGLSFHDARTHKGYLRHIMIRISTLGEVMLIVSVFEDDPDRLFPLLEAIRESFPQITSLYYCINPKLNDFILDLDIIHYSGKAWIEETLRDVRFRIGPKSFFQTNTRQAEQLFTIVEEFAGLTGTENVYDLYTGLGSIALFIAQNCGHVTGIEEVEAAIEDARINMEINGIQNATFYAGDVKDILTDTFVEKHGKADVLITDPPRAGMHADVVKTLLQLESPKIVYVSCNPSTQARDFNLLNEKYHIRKIQPVDMFPHTHHIENVALLELKNGRTA